eukprot:TRINITY_DN1876_c0_g3_i8.p1 TRINITY_DN1876_c0_g3~~TRINITY_DN1876_c0_g3_i8.p1  ORF type:complete len:120 (-),score=20.72 TRINITY_DN1876_c0_g3_i8:105-464(-)
MKSTVIALFLAAVFLPMILANAPMPGSRRVVEIDDNVAEIAKFAVQRLNEMSNSIKPLTLPRGHESILKAEVQVVSGLKYYLTLELSTGSHISYHNVEVWTQPWLHHTELTNHEIVNQP